MNITVYGASSGKVGPRYVEAAHQLGRHIALAHHVLINGAGRTGLMGATTEGCLSEGGRAVGVIPQFMVDQGWQHKGMTRLIVTPDMHSRKERMAAESDACIALPGGVGTLEELLEIITWKQLGLYDKPIVILNTDDYFAPLLSQLGRAVDEQFMHEAYKGLWVVATSPEEAVRLAEVTPRWDCKFQKLRAL